MCCEITVTLSCDFWPTNSNQVILEWKCFARCNPTATGHVVRSHGPCLMTFEHQNRMSSIWKCVSAKFITNSQCLSHRAHETGMEGGGTTPKHNVRRHKSDKLSPGCLIQSKTSSSPRVVTQLLQADCCRNEARVSVGRAGWANVCVCVCAFVCVDLLFPPACFLQITLQCLPLWMLFNLQKSLHSLSDFSSHEMETNPLNRERAASNRCRWDWERMKRYKSCHCFVLSRSNRSEPDVGMSGLSVAVVVLLFHIMRPSMQTT